MSTDPNATPQQPLNPDLAGYPTTDALVAGYRNSSDEGKRQRERADKLENLLVEVVQRGASNTRPAIPDRRSESPEDRLTQFGVPVDALQEFVAGQVQRAFAPITNGMQARTTVVGAHPDYVQFETDVAQFIASDPELAQRYPRMFEADPAGAMEYAFLKFGDSRRREGGAAGNGVAPNSSDAAIPSSRAGEGRRAPDPNHAAQEAYERFQRSGSSKDAAAFAKIRISGIIKDDFLNA